MSKRSQDQYTRCNISEIEGKEKKRYIKSSLHLLKYTLPLTKISYTNPPSTSMTTLISKTSPPFLSRVTKG